MTAPDLATDMPPAWNVEVTAKPDGVALNAVWGSSDDDVYAVGYKHTLLHRDRSDTGYSWVSRPNPASGSLNSIWGSGPADVYVVGDNGTILHASDGIVWTKQSSPRGVNLHGVWGESATKIFAVGDAGTILRSDGSGTWQQEPSATTEDLYSIGGSPGGPALAGGNVGTLFARGADGTWTLQQGTSGDSLTAIVAVSTTDAWAFGASFTLQRTDGINHYDGATWSMQSPPAVIGINGGAVGAGGDLFAVGADYQSYSIPVWKILHRPAGGTWTVAKQGSSSAALGSWLTAAWAGVHDVFAVGAYGIIVHRH